MNITLDPNAQQRWQDHLESTIGNLLAIDAITDEDVNGMMGEYSEPQPNGSLRIYVQLGNGQQIDMTIPAGEWR